MSQPLPKFATAARFERLTFNTPADRRILERSDLVLACAHAFSSFLRVDRIGRVNEGVEKEERASVSS